jgi:hypothetical protein
MHARTHDAARGEDIHFLLWGARCRRWLVFLYADLVWASTYLPLPLRDLVWLLNLQSCIVHTRSWKIFRVCGVFISRAATPVLDGRRVAQRSERTQTPLEHTDHRMAVHVHCELFRKASSQGMATTSPGQQP